jgi:hypothetical protein
MSKVLAICTSKHKGTLKNEVEEANFIVKELRVVDQQLI